MSKKYKPTPIIREIFDEYIEYIAHKILEQYGRSYQTLRIVRDTWRKETPYTASVEKFVIDQTNLFYYMTSSRGGIMQNPDFLVKFVDMVIDYLVPYTMRSNMFATPDEAKAHLKKNLWDNSTHIQRVLERVNKRRENKIAQAKNATNTPVAPAPVCPKPRRPRIKTGTVVNVNKDIIVNIYVNKQHTK